MNIMVEPSSALRNCTLVYLTSVRPHLEQVSCAVLSVWMVCLCTFLTLDWSFCLRNEGKSEGLLLVTVVFEPVSEWGTLVSYY